MLELRLTGGLPAPVVCVYCEYVFGWNSIVIPNRTRKWEMQGILSRRVLVLLFAGMIAAVAGCQPQVYTQDIPISSNPMGADLYADGNLVGKTPSSVSLERNRDHIITLKMPDYQQQDIIIKRKYQQDKVMMTAVSRGVQDADFFGNTSMGIMNGVNSMQAQEQSGEAYLLTPSAVSVRLVPVAGSAAAVDSNGLPTLMTLSTFDRQVISRVLEKEPSGDSSNWTSPGTGILFTITPLHAFSRADGWHRPFTLVISRGDVSKTVNGEALRAGDEHWTILDPATMQQANMQTATPDGMELNARSLSGAAVGAASALPSVGKTWKSSSSHSSTKVSNGGITTKKTKTTVSGGVSVDPGAAAQTLQKMLMPDEDGQ
ncbi:PEGA domain-containing protein [Pseudodesulfovibrio senegalensis]|uniref:PEGA domain-containing protein n=2 Tax=Pseudodesulfovibrio senegalensis TaxID=1721087 RepID=A0A6N6N037_9BACT|nr:PEGA domain-containing protein [Pseudodesulfovibrio senegalensis]